MKKVILILIFFLLTGCQVKYELDFHDNNLIENINIEIANTEQKKIENLKEYTAYSIFDNTFKKQYDVTYNEGNKFIANYQYTYNRDEFLHAMYIGTCFDAFNFILNDNTYILSTSQGFKCMVLDYNQVDNVQVIIKSNHQIIENNADIVEEDQLIWNIDENNATEKSIYVKFGDIKELSFFEKNRLGIIILSAIIILFISIIYYIVLIGKKNNEID